LGTIYRNIYNYKEYRLEDSMNIIGTIVIGFFAGLFARMLMPGRNSLGCILTILLGICGAVVGKLMGVALGFYTDSEQAGFFMSLIGAMVILYLHNVIMRLSAR
jgi:uncharacterized membrane protein YeaQ/YmgE (transglycosylase-associated protein family)